MAKVTIVFEDDHEDGTVNMSADFDPPVNEDNDPGTPAQWAGVKTLEHVAKQLGGEPDNG